MRIFCAQEKNLCVLFLELGVGYNTPSIIKYPFGQMTVKNPKATYACINYGEAVCPKEILWVCYSSPSSSRRDFESIVLKMPFMLRSRSLYPVVPFAVNEHNIGSFHFPPIIVISFSVIDVCFFLAYNFSR